MPTSRTGVVGQKWRISSIHDVQELYVEDEAAFQFIQSIKYQWNKNTFVPPKNSHVKPCEGALVRYKGDPELVGI